MQGKVRRWLVPLLQLVVGLGLLVALIEVVDWDRLRKAAAALSFNTLVLVAMLCVGAQAVLVLRWRALLQALDVEEPWTRSWHTVFAGLFLTNFLPGVLGSDGLRVVLLTKACGSASTAVGAVAYERLMQLALYIGLMSLGALIPVPWLQPWMRAAIIGIGAGALLALGLALYWLSRQSTDSALHRGGLLAAAWRFVTTMLIQTGRMQTRMRRHPRARWIFWVSSIVNIGLILEVWRLILLNIGEEAGAAAILLAAGAAAIAGAIPISIGALGTFEGAIVGVLALAGVSTGHAFLLALVVRVGFMLGSFVGLPSAVLLLRERAT